jgi:hypothetical protein
MQRFILSTSAILTLAVLCISGQAHAAGDGVACKNGSVHVSVGGTGAK